MKWIYTFRLAALSTLSGALLLAAQQPVPQDASPAPQQAGSAPAGSAADAGPVPLDWTPPSFALLSSQAALKNSFTFDRTMLAAAAGLLPDSDAPQKQAIAKLDGVSVHLLRFAHGIPDEGAVNAIRQAYHLRGWKHVVTTTSSGGPVHDATTDVWVVMNGVNVRGAVILAETPRSLTLATLAGNLSPADLLHLRGHFGIPRFDGGALGSLAAQ